MPARQISSRGAAGAAKTASGPLNTSQQIVTNSMAASPPVICAGFQQLNGEEGNTVGGSDTIVVGESKRATVGNAVTATRQCAANPAKAVDQGEGGETSTKVVDHPDVVEPTGQIQPGNAGGDTAIEDKAAPHQRTEILPFEKVWPVDKGEVQCQIQNLCARYAESDGVGGQKDNIVNIEKKPAA